MTHQSFSKQQSNICAYDCHTALEAEFRIVRDDCSDQRNIQFITSSNIARFAATHSSRLRLAMSSVVEVRA